MTQLVTNDEFMEQYINKAAVVAGIRKRLLPTIRDKHYDEWEEGQDSERKAILDIIDTLEVKEVDLEKSTNKGGITMNYEQKYNAALERAKKCLKDDSIIAKAYVESIFPELKEPKDVRIKKTLIAFFRDWERTKSHCWNVNVSDILAWLEKQGKIDLEHYKDGENEKRKFVGYGFLKCKGDFLSFKEGETYWLEYVGKDNYNVRSDNLLGQTFHIKPVELYTVFRPTTWLEKQGHMLDPDKVIAWLVGNICDFEYYVKRFKKDFGL